MASDTVTLASPPRTVLVAANGAMMLEFEDRVGVLLKDTTIVTDVCIPEERGERLLWPLSAGRCVMLGAMGVLKLYEGRRMPENHPGVLRDGDELIETMDVGDGSRLILVGRSVGDELLLPTPEYRFVWVSGKFERLNRANHVMSRRPLAWGVNAGAKSILLLAAQPEGESLIAVNLATGEARDQPRPAELKQRRLTGLSVERSTGHVALTTTSGADSELGTLPELAGKYTSLVSGQARLERPLWSPDGKFILHAKSIGERKMLAVVSIATRVSREIGALGDADEFLWLDNRTIAVVSWDSLRRIDVTMPR
jgi:hypothetical protein